MTDFTEIIQQMEKKFGAGALWQADQNPTHDAPVISTGSRKLDRATGVGGIPRGRIIEIYGPESSGKSTLSIHIMAEAQKQDYPVAYIDVEHAFDPTYATNCGMDTGRMLVSQPDSAEMALGIVEELTASGSVMLVVVDSVAALVPQEEVENDLSDHTVALQARLMSKAMRKLTPIASSQQAAVVFINQVRDTINTYGAGPRTTTPGGRALKFYASMRIELRSSGQIKERDNVIGNHVRARVVKNKVAPPFRTTELSIIYGEGISNEMDLIDDALEAEIITRKGNHYLYEERSIAMGMEKLRQSLRRDTDLASAIAGAIAGATETAA